nr:MAG TPA: hypothetical protein [Caudoviricetes sp.]
MKTSHENSGICTQSYSRKIKTVLGSLEVL